MSIIFSLILLAIGSAAFASFAYSHRRSSVWTFRIVSGVVWLVLFAAIDLLAALGVIPWLAAICLLIIAFFVNGFIALMLVRLILGPTRFADLAARVRFEELEERKRKAKG